MIECIREMAGRHYDIEVDVLRIQPTDEYEGALFDDSCDLLIEHLEFLYASAAGGAEVTMFCAPVEGTGIQLMALAAVKDGAELRGRTLAVRAPGRPEATVVDTRPNAGDAGGFMTAGAHLGAAAMHQFQGRGGSAMSSGRRHEAQTRRARRRAWHALCTGHLQA